jgi:outer membrane murein-binding lipoprotein Lpp
MSTHFDQLVTKVEETRADVEKAEEGNKAATARVRKSMQEIKALAQNLRKEMLELRDAGGKSAG